MIRVFVAVLIFMIVNPASASAHIKSETLWQRATDKGQHTIILELPKNAWGMKDVARDYSRRIDGLVIRTDRKCNEKVSCIRVQTGRYLFSCGGDNNWEGCSGVADDPGIIWLDNSAPKYKRKKLACHELGHALGLHHHNHGGCVGRTNGALKANRAEIAALNRRF